MDGIQRIGIFARRNIAPNEEITINYNFSHFGEAADCKCGSTACTGKLGLKRSKLTSHTSPIPCPTRPRKKERVDNEPPELKRPVHLTSLALLKTSQMVDSWWDDYGYRDRRLFLSHRVRCSNENTKENRVDATILRHNTPSSSPASVCSTTTEEDKSRTPPYAIPSTFVEKKLRKRNWYKKFIAGDHLPEMRAHQSFICGGKCDWTFDMNTKTPLSLPGRWQGADCFIVKRSHVEQMATSAKPTRMRLIHQRPGLAQARARGIQELVAFAQCRSKWNKRISVSIDSDRIQRLIDRVNGNHIFTNTDQVSCSLKKNRVMCLSKLSILTSTL